MPSRAEAGDSGAVKSLLSLLRFNKRKKKDKGEGVGATLPTPSPDKVRAQPAEAVATESDAANERSAGQRQAERPPEVPAVSVDIAGNAELGVPHPEKLLAALESAQNTEPLHQSTRLSSNPADLSGMLFAQRTKTRSGTGLALPARLADGTASGVNSGETPFKSMLADGINGSYVPYGTTTVGPVHSAANFTNNDSTAPNSVTHNLHDMLYADYDMLERMQARPDRSPGVVAGLSSTLGRREFRPPDVPSNLAPKTSSQLPLPAVPLPVKAGTAAGAAVAAGAVLAAGVALQDFGSAPLMHIQQVSQDGGQPQQQRPPPEAGPADGASQAARGEQQLIHGASSIPPAGRVPSPSPPRNAQQAPPQPGPPGQLRPELDAANEAAHVSGQEQAHPEVDDAAQPPPPQLSHVGLSAPRHKAASPRGHEPSGSRAGAEAIRPLADAAAPVAEVVAGLEGGAAAVGNAVAAPAMPRAVHGVHGEQPQPLSRPLKLTTACLGAHTTLCDSASDQSFQRALQRKMQMVYKWLQASDLTAPPDPRLEVPLGPETSQSSPHRGADGAGGRSSQRLIADAGFGRQGSGDRPGNGGSSSRAPAGLQAPGLQGGAAQGSAGPRGPAPASMFRPARGPPLLTAEEIAALEAIASTQAMASRANPPAEPVARPHNPQQQQEQEQQQQPRQGPTNPPAAAGGDGEPAAGKGSGAAAIAAPAAGPAALHAGNAHSLPGGEYVLQPHEQIALRSLRQGGEAAPGPGQQPLLLLPDSQLLQHSLSDLYASGQAALGANLPRRVLAGSDDAFTAAPEREPSGAPQAAGAAGSGGGGGASAGAVVVALEAAEPPSSSSQAAAAAAAPAAAERHTSSPAPPARTKTIAVASHCPPELQPQPPSASWTIDDFTLLKKLYEGSLSVVCQAQHKRSKRHVALKIYKRSRLHEMERFQLAREICLHIRIVHPHVVALYAAWKDSKYVYLALEWAPQGNMFDFLVSRGGRLGEEEAARVVMKPLFSALAFLHSQHFIHRDVKLENLLLNASCTLKLADFGLAIDQKFEQANTRLGTFGYFAPEVLDCPLKKGPFDLKDASVPGYDSRVDVWSAGVVGYEVLTGRAPFSASSPAKIIQAIRSRVLEFPGISEEGKDFLRSALTRDPAARPTARQLLAHPWIQRHCRGTSISGNSGGANLAEAAVPRPLSSPEDGRLGAAQAVSPTPQPPVPAREDAGGVDKD